jgi:hypothetical protein
VSYPGPLIRVPGSKLPPLSREHVVRVRLTWMSGEEKLLVVAVDCDSINVVVAGQVVVVSVESASASERGGE